MGGFAGLLNGHHSFDQPVVSVLLLFELLYAVGYKLICPHNAAERTCRRSQKGKYGYNDFGIFVHFLTPQALTSTKPVTLTPIGALPTLSGEFVTLILEFIALPS